jgi:hypothetical protein
VAVEGKNVLKWSPDDGQTANVGGAVGVRREIGA